MANQTGTATNLEDLFGKIVSFLTTSPALVAANQQWQVLRQYRDNVASITATSLVQNTGSPGYRRILHGFRYDPRSLGMDNPLTYGTGAVTCTNFVAGTSRLIITLRAAKAVATVSICSSPDGYYSGETLQNFRLEYSDNKTTWVPALTINNSPSYGVNETRTFAVPGSPGAHIHWRVRMDSTQNGATTGSVTWKHLLLLDSTGGVVNHFGSEVLLKATGTAGTDAIYTGIRAEYDAAYGWYNLFLNGYTGYNPLETSWFEQPGALPHFRSVADGPLNTPMVPCWNASMPYWFSASGRSFRFGLKVSTTFEGGYLGFLLPYATPAQYPYPLMVGGSMVPQDYDRSTTWRYSYNSHMHSVFPIPGCNTQPYDPRETVHCTLYIRLPTGQWGFVGGRASTSDANSLAEMTQSLSYPYTQGGLRRGVWPASVRNAGASGPRRDYSLVHGGGYLLQPLIIHQSAPAPAVWGELEGCYAISGFSNATENTTVWNGKTHIILQNATRNEVQEFWALALD